MTKRVKGATTWKIEDREGLTLDDLRWLVKMTEGADPASKVDVRSMSIAGSDTVIVYAE